MNNIKELIEKVKKDNPHIDENPFSHDGVYEYTKFIFEKYNQYYDTFSIEDLDFISNMGKLCYYDDKKIEYINKTRFNEETKQELINKLNDYSAKYDNNEYTIDHTGHQSKIGLFGQGIASLSNNPKFQCSDSFPSEFIRLCINAINNKNSDDVFNQFRTLFNKEKMGSSGIISQILHCLRPDLFPVFNSVGMKLYKKFLPKDYMECSPKKGEKVVPLKRYIDACKYLEDNCKSEWNINNYRIIDLIADENSNTISKPNNNNKKGGITMSDSDKISKNQILYGPPGTGKTYNTVVKAMEIIRPEIIEWENENDKNKGVKNYADIKTEFNNLLGSQLEFITFHQSYSYEEFVEGIKPYIPQSVWDVDNVDNIKLEDVKYIGKKGIFREICKRAIPNFDVVCEKFKEMHPQRTNFDKLLDFDYEKGENIINYEYGSKGERRDIPLEIMEKFYNQNLKFNSPKELKEQLIQEDYSQNLESYIYPFYNELLKIKQDLYNKPYVLIIDEINRGNISKIFGELITLIEEDKRGKLKVRLPYSQDEFTVPENLYIIGTMNTSDRSIASVDIALRRRFKFKEMMPDPELVADFECGEKLGKSFKEMFKTLNKKITILLDRDHQIGHSYFVKDKHVGEGITKLQTIWFDSVLPLLNEYFYGDWEKLQEILGEAETEKKDGEKYTSFIKKLSCKDMKTSCYDSESDCFDFVREDEIDFEKALENAFPKKKDDNKSQDAGQEE